MKLVLRADPALTCAVCNTDAFGDLICCEGCGVLGHEACLSEVGACPGSECEVQRAPAFVPERARRRRLPWVQGLAKFCKHVFHVPQTLHGVCHTTGGLSLPWYPRMAAHKG